MSDATTMTLDTAPSDTPVRDDRMPAGIPFIVANEFAERFCYYGINAILTIYMTQFLRLGDAEATTYHSLFKAAAYASPVIGAIVSDVFWAKFRTIMVFSLAYVAGCGILAFVPGETGLLAGLFLVALGTGGIKPCVSTNVGDQFTDKNQHLIERAFSYFYLAINAGSSISIFFCPVLLKNYGPKLAFGMPAAMMLVATMVFYAGRKKYAVVPPAGKAWLKDVFSKEGLAVIGRLSIIYIFVAIFWALWDQSNGQTWTLQAESSLMDKNIGFGFTLLPAQVQVVNGFFILALVPIFTFWIYPLMGKFFTVTPLRKMGIGFFTIASAFVVVARIEAHIQAGEMVSVWWQIFAYVILTASEVLVSITALEYSYKQAPLRMKSFIMALFLFSTTIGNLVTAGVNASMIRPLTTIAAQTGHDTWITLSDAANFVTGQKIDFSGDTGVNVVKEDGKIEPLSGTFMVSEIQGNRVRLMDAVNRKPVQSEGALKADATKTSTYRLVGPQYFLFFAEMMTIVGLLFIVVARMIKEKTYVRDAAA